MDCFSNRMAAWVAVFIGFSGAGVQASILDTVGVTVLRATATNLNGAGIRVGQVEAQSGTSVWEVNPAAVGQPTNLFTYFYSASPYTSVISTNTFPNSLGVESGHADAVAVNFYGLSGGVATNLAHVDNYEADTFINYYVNQNHAISERIVNQSFTFGTNDASVDQIFDNYAAQYNVLFVSGAGFNGQPVYSQATCYNGIGVGVADITNSPSGPTPDGRSKPDLVAPNPPDPSSSYTTAEVSGAAAILMQAGLRGDGGGDTNSATDIRTLKALLLNGAVKPADWTNTPATPLHPRYGAGVLNVFNSYQQLAGGKHGYIVATSVATGAAHPPTGATGTVSVLSGWDFNTNTSSSIPSALDGVRHYYFNVTNAVSNNPFTVTATLVWNRQQGQTSINNLGLFLYNAANSNLVACSTSRVDNVEHLWLPQLPQGRYDLQVLMKAGGINPLNNSEPYALVWEFFSQTLAVAKSGTNTALTWPVYPAGFVVETTSSLISPVWTTNNVPAATITNNTNYSLLPATGSSQFFRLRRP